ncbi:MAG: glycosyltransferase family 39 protein [Clostridia bacterium]|nr:glycosyltransferase family 39 protein [Clostridia bacterium]
MKQNRNIPDRIETAGERALAFLCAVLALFLSLVSLLHTTLVDDVEAGEGSSGVVSIREHIESVSYLDDNFPLNLFFLALSLFLCFLIVRRVRSADPRIWSLVLFGFTFLAGLIWVLTSQTAPSEDSYTVTSAARAFAENDFSAFETKRYFQNYSFQLGYVFFNEIIIRFVRLFAPEANLLYLQVLNAFFLALIYLFLVRINALLFNDPRVTVLTVFLLAVSAAPVISCSFVYGILPGLSFASGALWFGLRYLKGGPLRYGILSAVFIALAVMIKSNFLIWLVALFLLFLFLFFKRRRFLADCGVLFLALFLSLSVQPAVKAMYEKRSGVDLGEQIPYVSWFAMGLSESDLAPGWYTPSYTIGNFERSGRDPVLAAERSRETIRERLSTFLSSPRYANNFFYQKTVSQWNDPAYQSIWNNTVRGQYADKTWPAAWVCGEGKQAVTRYMDLTVQFTFFAFAAGCILSLKKNSILSLSLPLVVLGGFLYHLIGEGKSQYILPYYILACAFAAVGAVRLIDRIRAGTKQKKPEKQE